MAHWSQPRIYGAGAQKPLAIFEVFLCFALLLVGNIYYGMKVNFGALPA